MTVSEQVAALEQENALLKAKIAALESKVAGQPVYVPYPVYPPVPVQPYYPWPDWGPHWYTVTYSSNDNTTRVTA